MNERMGRFVVAYLECGNAKAAAITAGYSESYARSRAYKLLEHPSVVRALESGVVPDEWAPCSVTDERGKEILSAIVLATPEVFFDGRGNFDVESGGVFRHAIRELVVTEDASSRPVVKVKFWDKLRALRELRRWNGEGEEVSGVRCRVSGSGDGVAGDGLDKTATLETRESAESARAEGMGNHEPSGRRDSQHVCAGNYRHEGHEGGVERLAADGGLVAGGALGGTGEATDKTTDRKRRLKPAWSRG